jgi:hypothetical protein
LGCANKVATFVPINFRGGRLGYRSCIIRLRFRIPSACFARWPGQRLRLTSVFLLHSASWRSTVTANRLQASHCNLLLARPSFTSMGENGLVIWLHYVARHIKEGWTDQQILARFRQLGPRDLTELRRQVETKTGRFGHDGAEEQAIESWQKTKTKG